MTRPWLLIVASAVTSGALFGWIGAVGFAAVAATSVAATRQPWLLVLMVTLMAGIAGVARVNQAASPEIDPSVLASGRADVMVTSVPAIGPSGPRAVVRVERVRSQDGDWRDATGPVLVFFGDTAPREIGKGDRLSIVWSVAPRDAYAPDFRRFITSSGAGAMARSFHVTVISRSGSAINVLVSLRNTVTGRIESAIPGDSGSLLAGFVTGDDSGLSEEARLAFDRTSTSHITAVSGSNVAVLVAMWLVLMPSSRLRRSLIVQVAILATIWGYVLLVGLGAGAVRAGLFATIMLPASRFGRRADPLTALLTASAVMVLVSPDYARNAGFWLSLAASTAMVSVLPGRSQAGGRVVVTTVLSLVAAQMATLPITMWVFGGWSPGSLVANLLIGPLVTALFPVAFVVALAVTVVPWLGDLFGWIPELGATAIISIVTSMAGRFPILRSGPASGLAMVLIAAMSAGVIALLSVDVHRWLVRIAHARPASVRLAPAALTGAAVGLWLAIGAIIFFP